MECACLGSNLNAGLPNGFVRFGTVAHMILVYLHEYGDAGAPALSQDTGFTVPELSANLGRLLKFGFVFRAGRAYSHAGIRSHMTFSLKERSLPRSVLKRRSGAERSRLYRARLREKRLY